MTLALIYARKSTPDPRHPGRGRSLKEQETESRAVCDREGWTVVEVIHDDAVSASRHGRKKRVGWENVKNRIESGDVDVLVTWEASRAQRDLDAYTELRRLCADHRVRWSYGGQTYDMADRSDRFRTGLDALRAEDEADQTRERVLRAMRANADAGRPHGRLLYGYRRIYDDKTGAFVRQEPDPETAPIVREVAARFLAGESCRSIAADLTARGIAPPHSGEWDLTRVRRAIGNPAYAGLRVHRGEVVGEGDWPPIINRADHDRIIALFADPTRTTTRQNSRTHLLSGIARCGRCGGPMVYGKDRKGRRVYTCKAHQHVVRDGTKLDAYATAIVLERLARPDAAEAFDPGRVPPEVVAAGEEAIELRRRLDDAVDQFSDGNLTAATLAKIEVQLTPKIRDAERRARVAGLPTVASDIAEAPDVDAAWDGLASEQRRELVGALLQVTVLPTRPGVRTFNPDAVEVQFKA